jgi:hypothetical protein
MAEMNGIFEQDSCEPSQDTGNQAEYQYKIAWSDMSQSPRMNGLIKFAAWHIPCKNSNINPQVKPEIGVPNYL